MRNETYPGRYGSWDESIRLTSLADQPRGDFDVILVATPPDTHVPLALEALAEHPRAIAVEKPLCTPDLADAHRLADSAAAAGVLAFVGYNHAVSAATARIEELLAAGRIGTVTTIEVEFREHWSGILAAHPWLAGPEDSYLGDWRRGGGASGEHSHALHLWQHIAHASGLGRVREVTARMKYVSHSRGEYDEVCALDLVAAGGLSGRVVQDVVTVPPRKWARIQGTRGAIEWTHAGPSDCDTVVVSRPGEADERHAIPRARVDDFVRELQAIAARLEGNGAGPGLDLERGLETMVCLRAAHRSARERTPVQVDHAWRPGHAGVTAARAAAAPRGRTCQPRFDFEDLFILDMANNHQGRLEHGRTIVAEFARVASECGIRAALKLQLRQLDTFIHFEERLRPTNKHVSRFLSTRLAPDQLRTLTEEIRSRGLVTMATPFDEDSVGLLEDLNIELIKIGSCSATDWPLIERVAESGRPVVCSTGGLSQEQIDNLVSLFDHRRVTYALMHCVSIYPTPPEALQLNQIAAMKSRYPHVTIGFSTHEDPDETAAVQIAYAKGARLFERHVGLASPPDITLNAYSSTPRQIAGWLEAWRRARSLCGAVTGRDISPLEAESVMALQRGVFARKPLKEAHVLSREDVYFAMPARPGQLTPGEWRPGIRLKGPVERDAPLVRDRLDVSARHQHQALFAAIHTAKAMLNEARISVGTSFDVEFSHHYGIDRFHEVGAIFIECVNRAYCKKLIIQLPGQYHPSHYHERKEETFQVLSGVLEIEVDGVRRTLHPGDTQLVQQGVWHEFWSETGVVFEEISSTQFPSDSFYQDKSINRMPREERKTRVSHWGRYQL
jgi:N-acetylneuraminate synthase